MIQRLQSLFLLGAGALMIVFLFVPIWEKGVEPVKVELKSTHLQYKALNALKEVTPGKEISSGKSTWYIGLLGVLSAITALASIFQYKNRMLQIKLGLLNTLLISGVLGTIFLGISQAKGMVPENTPEEFQVGFYIPAICLLLNLLANRFIRKDEALVRSADRIR